MSYVRRTQALIDSVERKVDIMKNQELSFHNSGLTAEIGTSIHNAVRIAVELSLWRKAPELKSKLPDEWVTYSDHVDVYFVKQNNSRTRERLTLHFPETNKIMLPPKHASWDDVILDRDYITPEIDTWLDEADEAATKCEDIKAEFNIITRQLTDFLNSHASLNTAIKEMPELELYVPQEYLDKVKEKVIRTKTNKTSTTAKDLNIDVEVLTRAAVAHRINSANDLYK